MSALHGRLQAAMEQDRTRFSGEEFASARLGTVAGSVKRRRAVRSAGVGGASVVGASALAAGVINVPWSGLGSGVAPGAAPSVICTTTTPDAGDTGTLTVTELYGPGVIGDGPAWAVAVEGTDVATAFLEGDELVVEALEGGVQRVARSDDGGYRFTADGQDVVLSIAELDGKQIAVVVQFGEPGAGQEAPEPVVDCVTPEPSASASPVASPEPSVTPSSVAPVESAFQCGFDFTPFEGQAWDVIIEAGPVTQAQVRAKFLDWYGEQAPTTEVPDSDAPAWHAMLNPDVVVTDASLFRFVAVKDNVVVGTIDSTTNNAPGYVADGAGEGAPLEAFLWDRGAFTACGTASIDDAEIYAVVALDDGNTVDFAWNPVTP